MSLNPPLSRDALNIEGHVLGCMFDSFRFQVVSWNKKKKFSLSIISIDEYDRMEDSPSLSIMKRKNNSRICFLCIKFMVSIVANSITLIFNPHWLMFYCFFITSFSKKAIPESKELLSNKHVLDY
jgi:hypothetical protein